MTYEEKKFSLPEMAGLSKESVAAHLGLYAGYVKNCNVLMTQMDALRADSEKNAIAIAELARRFPFEFDGMRMHELYFEQFEAGVQKLTPQSALSTALAEQFSSVGEWEKQFRQLGMMRGIGWVNLCFDVAANTFHNVWIGEHQQGQLAALPIILTLDVWEHAYLADYSTTGRAKYIEAFFSNQNWAVAEKRFAVVQ